MGSQVFCLLFMLMMSTFADGLQNQSGMASGSKFCSGRNSAAAQSVNAFNAAMHSAIGESGNMLFSPIGLYMALGMAHLGANGETAEEISQALGYTDIGTNKTQIHEKVHGLSEELLQPSEAHNLFVANGLFSRVDTEIPEAYTNHLSEYYDGEFQSLDFENDGEGARQAINNWASEKTNEKVNNFFVQPLPVDTQVVLLNAIYFKGTWKIQFPPNRTYTRNFYSGRGRVDRIEMMTLAKERLPYYKDQEHGYKYLELPYQGDDVSMILALPLDHEQDADIVMTPENLCRITSNLRSTKMDQVAIPKFKLEYEKSMVNALRSLGITDAFSDSADFSGLQEGVKISDVLLKAVIEVNEQGSEAAAVSGFLFRALANFERKEFYANRPFAFSIIHKKAGVVLFNGKFKFPPNTH